MSDQFTASVRAKMQKALEVTRNDLGTIRTGRATPALIDNIIISAYGGTTKMKLMEMATITAQDNKNLLISPYDPATHDEIIKGIQENHNGLNPVSDGEQIRISIPPLSQERREEYLKLAKAKLEAGKVMLRQIRHEEMARAKRAEDAKEISEDDRKREEKQIQEVTDEMVKELDSMEKAKEQELMQI